MEAKLNEYAKLLIEVGLNVRKGQTVVISSPVDCAPFARRCAAAAYDAGCREVVMNWTDDFITREKYLRADHDIFDHFHSWNADFYNSLSEMRAAWLSIYSTDPEALSGVDPDRIQRASAASGKAIKPFRDRQMVNYFPWCIASVPTPAWAKKVFPGKTEEDAMAALWDSIFRTAYVGNGNASDSWRKHSDELKKRVGILNGYQFRYLKYRNSLGTDLTIELPENHIWEGGSEVTEDGIVFSANIPTEEVFTAPLRTGVNGIVFSSKPFCIHGDIAEDFSFTLKDGKIVKIEAKKGQKLLESAIQIDEGASYLGEVALVPWDSPISNSGILFYNTLFDENASCHLAFGDSYPCIEGADKMTAEERKALGLNASIAHEDFMIGTPDLSITGVMKDGREIPVFVDGNFAF